MQDPLPCERIDEFLERYVDTLANLVCVSQSIEKEIAFDPADIESGVKAVIGSMTLGCPSCKVALDPDPDGCCAMRCVSCSKYFCFLCFIILPGNVECHNHVRQCPKNSSNNVFPPLEIRLSAQKSLQINAIRNILRSLYGPKWRNISNSKQIIEKCQDILSSSGITSSMILQADDQHAPNPVLEQNQFTKIQLFLSFFLGIFLTILCMNLFYPSPAMECPVPSFSDSNYLDAQESYHPNPPPSSFVSSLWNIFLYLLRGVCIALTINYFTFQTLADIPLVGALIVLIWYPLFYILYYALFFSLFVLYYLNIALLLVMVIMVIFVRQSQTQSTKYQTSCAVLTVTLSILFVIIHWIF